MRIIFSKEVLDFFNKLIDFKIFSNRSSYELAFSMYNIMNLIRPRPNTRYDTDRINKFQFFNYNERLEIAKIYMPIVLNDNFKKSFRYYYNDYSLSPDEYQIVFNKNGCMCYENILLDVNDKPIEIVENFFDIFLKFLYNYWDETFIKYKSADNNLTEEQIASEIFRRQCNGIWFIHNGFNCNFLKIYLSYLKNNKNILINIFCYFKKEILNKITYIQKGLKYYSNNETYTVLSMLLDFYEAIIDIYGINDNIINKLQKLTDYIFKEKLETEKLAFMNTFLFTVKYNSEKLYNVNSNQVYKFWVNFDKTNYIIKKIFIKSLIYSWNKSALPKIKNSLNLLIKLNTNNYYNSGFVYNEQKLFYNELIKHANLMKKSVRTILFSKIMTTEDGGIL